MFREKKGHPSKVGRKENARGGEAALYHCDTPWWKRILREDLRGGVRKKKTPNQGVTDLGNSLGRPSLRKKRENSDHKDFAKRTPSLQGKKKKWADILKFHKCRLVGKCREPLKKLGGHFKETRAFIGKTFHGPMGQGQRGVPYFVASVSQKASQSKRMMREDFFEKSLVLQGRTVLTFPRNIKW